MFTRCIFSKLFSHKSIRVHSVFGQISILAFDVLIFSYFSLNGVFQKAAWLRCCVELQGAPRAGGPSRSAKPIVCKQTFRVILMVRFFISTRFAHFSNVCTPPSSCFQILKCFRQHIDMCLSIFAKIGGILQDVGQMSADVQM